MGEKSLIAVEEFTHPDEVLHLEAYDGAFFENHIMTIEETAKYLKVCPKTIRRLIHDGNIPVSKVGKNYRFMLNQLIQWLKSGGCYEKRR